MAWRIKFDRAADKELGRLDPQIARRILSFLFDRVANLEDPRSVGEALQGTRLGDMWKYRVGDYRIICSIEDKEITVVVASIGNRREVYRTR